jgi:hypothetical protein
MISLRATVLAGAVIGLACGGPTDMCGCPPIAPSAAVLGRVRTSAGAPVAQALVSAYIDRHGNCSRQTFPDGTSLSRGDGTYTVGIAGFQDIEAACVRVRVRAPLGSGLPDAPDTTVTLSIRSGPPFDSTRVDATLGVPFGSFLPLAPHVRPTLTWVVQGQATGSQH